MSIPGSDAIGRLAVGQIRQGLSLVVTAGSYTLTGASATFGTSEAAAPGSYTLTGNTANDTILVPEPAGSFVVTGFAALLSRTGGDFDQVYGGVGHYLEEIERLKSLQKITRKTPAPIVQAPVRPLQPMASAPVTPQPPAIDMQAIAAQRMAAQQAQAEQAMILKRRRQAIELLLLAS